MKVGKIKNVFSVGEHNRPDGITWPHWRFIVYLLVNFSRASANLYLRQCELPDITNAEYTKVIKYIKQNSASFSKYGKKAKAVIGELNINIPREAELKYVFVKNRNMRIFVECSASAGMPLQRVTKAANRLFDANVSDEDILRWSIMMYDVSDIPPKTFVEVASAISGNDDEVRLRVATQLPSVLSMSALQKHFILNFKHEWSEIWSMIAGMTVSPMILSIQRGQAQDAKSWSEILKTAIENSGDEFKSKGPRIPLTSQQHVRDIDASELE